MKYIAFVGTLFGFVFFLLSFINEEYESMALGFVIMETNAIMLLHKNPIEYKEGDAEELLKEVK